MASIASLVTALGAIVAALVAGYINLRKILAPFIRRRRFKVAIVVTEQRDREARAFAARLRENGFKNVELTRDPLSCLGRNAVVLWHPGDLAAAQCLGAKINAPDATVLALSHSRLKIDLSERTVACNSQMRLMGDLAALAELSGVIE